MNKKVVMLLLSCLSLIIFISCNMSNDESAVINHGSFEASIIETGELLAVNSRIISIPNFSWHLGKAKIIELKKEGLNVKQGAIVAQLDTSALVRVLRQKEAELQIAQADLNKLLVEHNYQMRNIYANVEAARASFNRALIDTQRVKFEPLTKKELYHLNLQKEQLTLKNNEFKIESTHKIQEEELMIQKEKINQIISAIDKAERNLKRFTIKAPANGMIEYRKNRRTNRKVQIGDEFWPGRPIIGLPDLSRIKVKTQVNETDISKLKLNQKVIVKLDAYPQKSFTGHIIHVGKICHKEDNESKIKIFNVEVLLDNVDIILRPGMTVSCEIIVAELNDVFFVDNVFINQENDSYFLYIKKSSDVNKIRVTLGPRNSKSVVVYGDIDDGDEIVLPKNKGEA